MTDISGWWIDSGATRHIAKDKKGVIEFTELKKGEQRIYMGNNTYLDVEGIGSYRLDLGDSILVLKDVFYASGIRRNLISVPSLMKKGLEVSVVPTNDPDIENELNLENDKIPMKNNVPNQPIVGNKRVLGNESQHSVACKVFVEILVEDSRLDVCAYTIFLRSYARSGVFGKARNYPEELRILKEMAECNCEADAITYNELVATYARASFVMKELLIVISAYVEAEREDEALYLFYRVKELGCVPNACTYNTVLGLPGKKSRSGEMLEVLLEMKSNGCIPNRVTWNTMLAMCGKRGMESPCLTTYNALLNAIARNGDWRAAESVMDDIRKKGFKPNELYYSLLLQSHA
ncbi:pentatricopeptide repeat-containing protein At2g18940, chloroplastic-like [Asparagus officinalis]|uniref:pentatricopeptide repeat-containing protein At2g18940, chloroplastic-like n=1 Tax=Asparagus officinalis TaxID=4686 RepID=UPI00098DE816|nr:pentatricopeptide repeat-containing protein At2g18940, chloroplastic-like [Asparagus officinalis]